MSSFTLAAYDRRGRVCSPRPARGGASPVPVVFRYRGIRFYFFSNEGNPREPIHIHALRGEAEAKFWLYPSVHPAGSVGFDARSLAELRQMVEQRRSLIEETSHEQFG